MQISVAAVEEEAGRIVVVPAVVVEVVSPNKQILIKLDRFKVTISQTVNEEWEVKRITYFITILHILVN